ncbi:SDR family NAD(P)-dependent oxidoreductase [Clostridiaceae bacterium 35-E11]
MKFTGKRALVTGSAQGIGLAIAKRLATEGIEVILTDINLDKAQEEASNLTKKYGIKCYAKKMDVSNEVDVKTTIEEIIKENGVIDILVNNAGICYPAKPLEEISQDEWLKVFRINVLGVVNCINAVSPYMKKQMYGRIVNMSSSSAYTGGIAVSPTYSVSKAGVTCLTKTLAKSLGIYNITVNCLLPGVIRTAMTENLSYNMDTWALKRLGEVEEVADLVAFLSSDDSSYITGTATDINGGLYMR